MWSSDNAVFPPVQNERELWSRMGGGIAMFVYSVSVVCPLQSDFVGLRPGLRKEHDIHEIYALGLWKVIC